jgi:uncharacterized protein YhbP (UPF0306 family)
VSIKEHIYDYLRDRYLMTLCTGEGQSWGASIYYFVDKDLNLFFLSPPSRHVSDIEASNKVAGVVTDSNQPIGASPTGIQFSGTVGEVSSPKVLMWFFSTLYKMNTEEKKLTWDNYKNKLISSKIYRIEPTYIKYMNKELFADTYGIWKCK